MRRTLVQITLLIAAFVVIAFGVFLVNQTAQLVELADRLHPLAGDATFWALLTLYAFCLLVPLFLVLRLPPPLEPPEREDSPEFERHLERLAKRLRKNPRLAGRPLGTREDVESALASLDDDADHLIRTAGSEVFLTTAISQNGSLDGVMVLAAQSKLILQVARTYYQRPTLRDLVFLYTNVAATALISNELDDIDLSEQVQPVLSSVMGSAAGAVPGLQAASSLIVNSVTTGAANAFLTLRVGLVTKAYCRALVLPERKVLRRTAIGQATQMLGGIALTGARRISTAVLSASKDRLGGFVTGIGSQIKSTGSSIVDKVTRTRKAPAEPE